MVHRLWWPTMTTSSWGNHSCSLEGLLVLSEKLMQWIVLVSLSGGSGGFGGPLQGGLGGLGMPGLVGCCIHQGGRASPRGQRLPRGPENKHRYYSNPFLIANSRQYESGQFCISVMYFIFWKKFCICGRFVSDKYQYYMFAPHIIINSYDPLL